MSVLRCLQQAVPYAIQENIYPENKWSSILCRVYDVWRMYRKMPGSRCYQTHCLRKAFDGIQTVEIIGILLIHPRRRMTPATYAFSFIPDYVLPEVPVGTSGGMFFDFPSFGITKNVYIYSIILLTSPIRAIIFCNLVKNIKF